MMILRQRRASARRCICVASRKVLYSRNSAFRCASPVGALCVCALAGGRKPLRTHDRIQYPCKGIDE